VALHFRGHSLTILSDLIDTAAHLARRSRGQLVLHLPQY